MSTTRHEMELEAIIMRQKREEALALRKKEVEQKEALRQREIQEVKEEENDFEWKLYIITLGSILLFLFLFGYGIYSLMEYLA